MKKYISLLLCLCLLLSLAACSRPSDDDELFYYRRSQPDYTSEDGLVAPETRIYPRENGISWLFEEYFSGPNTRGLISPFPRGTRVISWNISRGTLDLTLSDSFADLTGVDLSFACSCIARTLLGILPVDQISIQVPHRTLNGKSAIVMSHQNLRFADDSLEQLRGDYLIYYVDPRWRYLVGVEHSVSLADPAEIARFLVQRLMSNPLNSELLAPIPRGTKLLDTTVKNGLCTLDFSPEFEHNTWSKPEAQRLTLLSIVNTLAQIDGIDQVEFCIDGNPLIQYGALNISAPFVPEERAVGMLRGGIGEFDATCYVSNGSPDFLVGIPTKLRQSAGTRQEILILQELIRMPSINGFYSTIPSGTIINQVVTEQGVCHIDLSAEFLSNPATLRQSVHAIAASVCSVPDISSVCLTVNGQVPITDSPELFDVLTPQSDWFG